MEGQRVRIEVDPEQDVVTLDGRVLNEICAHARETWPEECCGLLTGEAPGRYRSVYRCRNEMTRLHRSDPQAYPRDGRRAFHMNELDYVRVREQAAAQGERVTAVYHSHVEAGAYLSELDQAFATQELFPFPEADHLVIGVFEGRVKEVGLFRRASAGAFVGHPVVAASP